ncbi:hypothetical protein ILUMI_24714 [Ignelater luminosus]|uniref:Uncharacterized protein n=1 Tax=Ignelater luminosus TaxID=2038154 RepID=A0A8K0C9Z3_IGNLU|nr:hypothetical protein ILUMI_24714 [Ignelater luminosus]
MPKRGYGYIKIETLNVRGNLLQKKLKLTSELKENQIDIVVLIETKHKGLEVEAAIDMQCYTQESRNMKQSGLALYMLSEKLMILVWNVWSEDETIIAAYGPNEDATRQRNQDTDVRVGRSMELCTDHYFLKVKLKMLHGKGSQIQDKVLQVREQFLLAVEQEIANQAEALREAGLVELKEAFKQVLLEVAEQVCSRSRVKKRKKKRTKWWNAEVKTKTKLMKGRFKEYLRESEDEKTAAYSRYKEERRVVRDTVKRAQEQP